LRLEYGTEIKRTLGVGAIIQRPLRIPADEDIGVLLIHRVQHPCIGARPLIAHHHISCLEAILLQALPGLRLGDLDIMQAAGDQVDDEGEPIIPAGGAAALSCGPITGEEAQGLGPRRQSVQGEHPFDQRFEKRRTAR
jgi:hypothetical protein